MNKSYVKKPLAVAVIFLFFGVSVISSTGTTFEKKSAMATFYEGSLSGYVNDSSMNPIVGAVVTVFFHGTYEKNYTDSSGYYHVTDIPICNCTKKVIAYKEGYQGEEVFLSIYENTTYDFVLMPLPPSDLYCWGNLTWIDVQPGETVNGEFWIRNKGGFDLYWEITEWPEWGIWDFGSYFPKIPPGGLWIVFVNVTAPTQENATFAGHVKVVNKNNASDYAIINASLATHAKIGYNVTERIVGIIGNLYEGENETSFNVIIGLGLQVIEYDDGGMVAFVIPYFFMNICWSGDFLFDGTLLPHFIKGIVRYRVN